MVWTLASETQPVLATPSMMVRAPPPPPPQPTPSHLSDSNRSGGSYVTEDKWEKNPDVWPKQPHLS